jgi:23S rRNA pseudouridine1911/1915/1917 synthase
LKQEALTAVVSCISLSGKRLDQVLSKIFSEYSRSYLKKLILTNKVVINSNIVNRPDKTILGGEIISIYPFFTISTQDLPEKIDLDVVYEDNEILVINKPAGFVVHPGSGNNTGTLLNALLYHYKDIKNLPRSGIVHRLDKNTSGLMVIAKTMFSYNYLVTLLKKRNICREYQGIVKGNMISGGTIDAPIQRHLYKRTRMMVHNFGKKSVTHYKIIHRFKFHTHIKMRLETGRTHQIRVHMLHIGYPLIGDSLYSGLNRFSQFVNHKPCKYISQVITFPRQALHASSISFRHPTTRNLISWTIPLPKDIKNLLLCLSKI